MSYLDLDPLSAFATVPSEWLAQLLANTEALHDGSGFATGAIPASALSTSALLLGYVSRSNSQTGISSEADLNSMSLNVTIPSGGRHLILFASLAFASTSAGTQNVFSFKSGSTLLKANAFGVENTSNAFTKTGFTIISPTAGSHTYKLTAAAPGGGTLQNYGDAGTGFINEFLAVLL